MKTQFPERITKPIRETLDTRGFAFPKPGPREKPERTKDGRLREGAHRYRRTKQVMFELQMGRCGKPGCNNRMPTPAHGHRHHPGGRGLGGSKRDDSKTVLWCISCHLEEHEEIRKGAVGDGR